MSLYYSRDIVTDIIDFDEFRNAVLSSITMFIISFPLLRGLLNATLFIKILTTMLVCVSVYILMLLLLRDKIVWKIIRERAL